MSTRVARCIASLAWSALVGSTLPVRAHSPVEITQVVSYGERGVVLATNRGLIVGRLAPRSFSLLCIEALPIGLDGSYRVAQLRSGRLLLASSSGLVFSDDGGCSWVAATALSDVAITDLVPSPEDPATLFVATAGPGQVAVRVSHDGGETFRTLIALSDVEAVRSLVVSAGQTLSLHASGYRAPLSAPDAHFVLSSSDGGTSWTRFPVALAEGERELTLLTAHPTLPGVLVARASAVRPELGERALLSRDHGQTFASVATLRLLRSATIGTDGTDVMLAGVDGVFAAQLAAPIFVKQGESAWISQVQRIDQAAVACGYYEGIGAPHNGIAAVRPSGFTPWFSFAEVHDVRSCPEPSQVASKCQAAFKDFKLENDRFTIPIVDSAVADAGTLAPPASGPDASATPSPPRAEAEPSTLTDAGALGDAHVEPAAPLADAASEPLAPVRDALKTSREGCALANSQSPNDLALLLLVLSTMARGRRAARPPSGSGPPGRRRT